MRGTGLGKLAALFALAVLAAAPAVALAATPKGAIGVATAKVAKGGKKGAGGVEGAVASSPGFAQAAQVTAAAKPSPHERTTGLDAQVGSLPFTGWDLIILGGVSMVLSGAGFAVRRLSMPRAPPLSRS